MLLSRHVVGLCAAMLTFAFSTSTTVHAAGQRSFVATTGVDNAACSIAAPCRSFGAAVTATSAGGEVIVLDSGGYGPVTITKPIAIIAPSGVYAGISVLAGDGVTVTTSNVVDRVTLNGLTINNQGATGSGIVYNGVGRLLVVNTVVNGFSSAGSAGLNFTPTASSNLRVENSEFRLNATGINVEPPSGAIDVRRSRQGHCRVVVKRGHLYPEPDGRDAARCPGDLQRRCGCRNEYDRRLDAHDQRSTIPSFPTTTTGSRRAATPEPRS